MMHGVNWPIPLPDDPAVAALVDLNFIAASYLVNGVAQALADVIDQPSFVDGDGLSIDYFSATNTAVRVLGDAQAQFLTLPWTCVVEWIERSPPSPRATTVPLVVVTDHVGSADFYEKELRLWTRREAFAPNPAATRGLAAVFDENHPEESSYYRESLDSTNPDVEIAIDDVNRLAVSVEPGDVTANIRTSVNGSDVYALGFGGVKMRDLTGLSHVFMGDEAYTSTGFVRHIDIRRLRLLPLQPDAQLAILSTAVGD
ncbi:MAG: hypothetical protein VW338_04710 [Rhodospirillaceae bacterium]